MPVSKEKLKSFTVEKLVYEYGRTISMISKNHLADNAFSQSYQAWSSYQHNILEELNSREKFTV